MGNMIGYYTTMKFYSGEYAYNPGIKNTVFRNSLMYSVDTPTIVSNTSVDIYAINTKYTGTELYSDKYNELGFNFGYNKDTVDSMNIGASYLTSNKEDAIKVNVGFTF